MRVPTVEFRHVGDKYADLIQEAIDNLGLEYQDVKFVTPEDDPAATPLRHDGGLSGYSSAPAASAAPAAASLRNRASIGTAPRNSIRATPSTLS